jgi:hypothetical protein
MEGMEFLLYAFLTEAPREGERTVPAPIAILLGEEPPPPVLIGLKWRIDSKVRAYTVGPAWELHNLSTSPNNVRVIKNKGMRWAAWETLGRRKKCM